MKCPLLIALSLTLILTTACQSTNSTRFVGDDRTISPLAAAPSAQPYNPYPDVPPGDVYFEQILSRY